MKILQKGKMKELKAGLPLEKSWSFVAMQKEGVAKTLRKSKKKEKRKTKEN